MKIVSFLPEAEEEMAAAARYYESRAYGLGKNYLLEVERAVKAIKESPETWPVIKNTMRRRLVRRFPFGIIYCIEPEEIVIIAVAHLRRRPKYWEERTTN
jgi:plasmid stabilization system protein ParE